MYIYIQQQQQQQNIFDRLNIKQLPRPTTTTTKSSILSKL